MVLIVECSGTINVILPVLFENSQNNVETYRQIMTYRVWFLASTPCFTPGVLSTVKERQVSSYKSIPNWYTLEVPKWLQPNGQCNDEWS